MRSAIEEQLSLIAKGKVNMGIHLLMDLITDEIATICMYTVEPLIIDMLGVGFLSFVERLSYLRGAS